MEELFTQKIDLLIAGRNFPVKVGQHEVDLMRKIERELNQSINEFNVKYQDKDKLDCVIMTLLTISVDNAKNKQADLQNSGLVEHMNKINHLLDSSLS